MPNTNFAEWLSQNESNEPRQGMKSRWSLRYKRSIDCSSPKGFSQKNYCKRQRRGGGYNESTVGTEEVDASQIMAVYNKALQSVELVRMYDQQTGQRLLTNISTIGSLAPANAYGVFMSSENQKVLGADVEAKIKLLYPNDPTLGKKLQKLPKHTLLQYLPNLNPNSIIPSDVIHVDVRKHLLQHGDSPAAILEIASTIVHEATHVLEFEQTGKTNDGPASAAKQAEGRFLGWAKANWPAISQRFSFQGDFPLKADVS